jgi:hypothetical protein
MLHFEIVILTIGFLARNSRSSHSQYRSHASLSPNVGQTSIHHLTARRLDMMAVSLGVGAHSPAACAGPAAG